MTWARDVHAKVPQGRGGWCWSLSNTFFFILDVKYTKTIDFDTILYKYNNSSEVQLSFYIFFAILKYFSRFSNLAFSYAEKHLHIWFKYSYINKNGEKNHSKIFSNKKIRRFNRLPVVLEAVIYWVPVMWRNDFCFEREVRFLLTLIATLMQKYLLNNTKNG